MITDIFIELLTVTKKLQTCPQGEGAELEQLLFDLQKKLFHALATSTPGELHAFRDTCRVYRTLEP